MYVVGGFDGSRLNDMYHIAFERSGQTDSDSADSVSQHTVRVQRPPTSAASGVMQTVPSDLSIHQISVNDAQSDIGETEDDL